jgi:hypothetical protein
VVDKIWSYWSPNDVLSNPDENNEALLLTMAGGHANIREGLGLFFW